MLTRLLHFLRLVFADQIRLRRQGLRLSLHLTPRGTVEFTNSQIERKRVRAEQQALITQMHRELLGVLRAGPEPELRMPHLLQFSEGLQSLGLNVLKAMPLPALVRALGEFEQSVTNWSPVGLATLRSKMAVTISERRRAGEADMLPAAAPAVAHSDVPRTGAGPEVTEVDVAADAADPTRALLAAYGAAQPLAEEASAESA